MRKHKTLKIDDKEITVKELRVKDVIDIFGDTNRDTGLFDKAKEFLPRFTDNLTLDDLIAMAPSEIKTVYDDFKEVNAVFFDVAREMGLNNVLQELKASIQREFSGTLAASLRQAIPAPLTTDTPSS